MFKVTAARPVIKTTGSTPVNKQTQKAIQSLVNQNSTGTFLIGGKTYEMKNGVVIQIRNVAR